MMPPFYWDSLRRGDRILVHDPKRARPRVATGRSRLRGDSPIGSPGRSPLHQWRGHWPRRLAVTLRSPLRPRQRTGRLLALRGTPPRQLSPGSHRPALGARQARPKRDSGQGLATIRRSGVDISSGDPTATLHRELDVLEARTGRPTDTNTPHQQTRFGFVERRRRHRVGPTEPPADGPAVKRVGPFTPDHPQHRQQILIRHQDALPIAAHQRRSRRARRCRLRVTERKHRSSTRRAMRGHEPARLTACFAFFSPRFSFSDLPDFFDSCWRGDLSAMAYSFRLSNIHGASRRPTATVPHPTGSRAASPKSTRHGRCGTAGSSRLARSRRRACAG